MCQSICILPGSDPTAYFGTTLGLCIFSLVMFLPPYTICHILWKDMYLSFLPDNVNTHIRRGCENRWRSWQGADAKPIQYCADHTLLLCHVPLRNIMVRRTILNYSVDSCLASSSVFSLAYYKLIRRFMWEASHQVCSEQYRRSPHFIICIQLCVVCLSCALLFLCEFFKFIVVWILVQNGAVKEK